MERQAVADGRRGLGATRPPRRHLFELARREDEPELRRLLREIRLDGEISITFEREPDFRRAAAVEGRRHRTFVARDTRSGHLVGLGTRSVRRCYVNGEKALLPYLGSLRVDRRVASSRRLLPAGYELCRQAWRPDELPFCLTSIVADNHAARRLLTAGLDWLPTYRHVGRLVTLVLRASRRAPWRLPTGIERASDASLPEVVDCLRAFGRGHQFHPVWEIDDLRSNEVTPGLAAEDFLVTRRRGRVVACLAVWDQRGFKQSVIRGYGPRLRRLRPLINLAGPLIGVPRLPRAGSRLDLAYASHLTNDGDPGLLIPLLAEACRDARRKGCSSLALGLAEGDPLLPLVCRSFRCRTYPSDLYLVHWQDGRGAADSLDSRPPHVELATL